MTERVTATSTRPLPSWPFVFPFVAFPFFWLLGLRDFVWIVGAMPMALYLTAYHRWRAPRGFGIWMVFLIWMFASASQLDTFARVLGFGFRALLYVAATVIFLYVYNADERSLSTSRLTGVLTAFTCFVTLCGFLALLNPTTVIPTLASKILPGSLLSNEVVRGMAFVRFTQFNPDGYFDLDPRPSAPFLYTNNWGNAYSLLLPLVIVYLIQVRRTPRFLPAAVLVPISFVPAFLTLNRGMFLALGVGVLYVGVRAALRGQITALAGVLALIAVAAVVLNALPVESRVENRLQNSATNEARLSVYQDAFEGALESPLFGYGAPRAAAPGAPAVGTQGQFWMALFSHGFIGAALFLAWLLLLVLRTARAPTTTDLWLHTGIVMALVEAFYYGMLGAGFTVVMISGGLALRRRDTTRVGSMARHTAAPDLVGARA